MKYGKKQNEKETMNVIRLDCHLDVHMETQGNTANLPVIQFQLDLVNPRINRGEILCRIRIPGLL